MNEFAKIYRTSQGPAPAHVEPNLDALKNHLSNENMNIINGIFNAGGFQGFQPSGGSSETERERRIKLREMERKKRMEGVTGGDYGQVEVPNIGFHSNPPV